MKNTIHNNIKNIVLLVDMAIASVTQQIIEYTPVMAFDNSQQTQDRDIVECIKKVSQNTSGEFIIITIPGQVVNYDALFITSPPKLTHTEHMYNFSQCYVDDCDEYDPNHPDKSLIEQFCDWLQKPK